MARTLVVALLLMTFFAGCATPDMPPAEPATSPTPPAEITSTQEIRDSGVLPGPGRCIAYSCIANGDGRLYQVVLQENQSLAGADLTIDYFQGAGTPLSVHAELLCLSSPTCPTKVLAVAEGPLPLHLVSSTTTLRGAALELQAWQPDAATVQGTAELVSVEGHLDLLGPE